MAGNLRKKKYLSIDLFSGAGGLTTGMHKAGFETIAAVELNEHAVAAYKMNFKKTHVFEKDIRLLTANEIKKKLRGRTLHLLAGCPPCQGFSSIRTLNGKNIRDQRNSLILEYLRIVKELRPLTIMLENVPGLKEYYLFKDLVKGLREEGYHLSFDVVNVKDYGVPQSRRRLVMVGSILGQINVAEGNLQKSTVRNAIGTLENIDVTSDPVHKIKYTPGSDMLERIKLTPKDGGSWKNLPEEYHLKCHSKRGVGFNDVYGRLRWDDYSTTITGGCLNPSKGRFLHPTEDRGITAREAALIQSFPKTFKFPINISKDALGLLIGNALPPKFSYIQSKNIRHHLDLFLQKAK